MRPADANHVSVRRAKTLIALISSRVRSAGYTVYVAEQKTKAVQEVADRLRLLREQRAVFELNQLLGALANEVISAVSATLRSTSR